MLSGAMTKRHCRYQASRNFIERPVQSPEAKIRQGLAQPREGRSDRELFAVLGSVSRAILGDADAVVPHCQPPDRGRARSSKSRSLQDLLHLLGEIILAVGLDQELLGLVHVAALHQSALEVARGEQHREAGPQRLRLLGAVAAAHAIGIITSTNSRSMSGSARSNSSPSPPPGAAGRSEAPFPCAVSKTRRPWRDDPDRRCEEKGSSFKVRSGLSLIGRVGIAVAAVRHHEDGTRLAPR